MEMFLKIMELLYCSTKPRVLKGTRKNFLSICWQFDKLSQIMKWLLSSQTTCLIIKEEKLIAEQNIELKVVDPLGPHRVFYLPTYSAVQFSRSVVSDSATPLMAARQASPSITSSRSSLRLMSIESVMPSSHLILCRPLLLIPLIFPSIRVFSNESVLCIRWPKYWSFSVSISPSNE